jgi:hypothetical protein
VAEVVPPLTKHRDTKAAPTTIEVDTKDHLINNKDLLSMVRFPGNL